MKSLLSLALLLACSLPAFAGHHGPSNAQIRQANRAARRHHNAQQQQIVYVPAQRVRIEKVYVAPQQIQQECHNDGQLQFRQQFNGGCQNLYR